MRSMFRTPEIDKTAARPSPDAREVAAQSDLVGASDIRDSSLNAPLL